MGHPSKGAEEPSKYGIRYEDLTEDERAYYREYLPAEPAGQGDGQPSMSPEPEHIIGTRQRAKKPRSRWFWLPHSLAITAVVMALASFTVVPAVYSDVSADLRRNYVVMWAELAFFFLVFAALLYGIFFLSRFTDHDDEDDERLIRPTDYADQLLDRDIQRATRKPPGDGLYDSSWIIGKKND